MKKFSILLFSLFIISACKNEPKELIARKWEYDVDEMFKVTEKNLEKLETKEQILKSYKDIYLNKYRGISYDLDKSGKLVWDDHGTIRNGSWGLADNDSTLIIKSDSIQMSFKINSISSKQMIFTDNVVNTSPQFKLRDPILKHSK